MSARTQNMRRGLAAALLCVSGCAVIDLPGDLAGRTYDLFHRGPEKLPAIQAPAGSIQLEVMFVERPVNDPLLKEVLWREVDQVSALSADVRGQLEENGFRVGHVSATPPRALQKLLGLTAEFTGLDEDANQEKLLTGRRLWLRPNMDAEVQTSRYYDRCEIRQHDTDTGERRSQAYENAKCVFRLKAERLQDGWANVEFTPEIHHGRQQMRHVATQGGWQMASSQEVEPLFNQRFSVALNVGEMIVISADRREPDTLGTHFFLGGPAESKVQQLLVVRLADIRRSE